MRLCYYLLNSYTKFVPFASQFLLTFFPCILTFLKSFSYVFIAIFLPTYMNMKLKQILFCASMPIYFWFYPLSKNVFFPYDSCRNSSSKESIFKKLKDQIMITQGNAQINSCFWARFVLPILAFCVDLIFFDACILLEI